MKNISFFFCVFSLFILQACSLNTKFDDDEYRPVGASTPMNSETHTISETRKRSIETPEENDIESKSTRYVHPNSQVKDNTVIKKTINSPSEKQSSSVEISNKKASKPDIITTTITNIFGSRYGDSDTIIKISKTVQIHCEQADKVPGNPQMTVCNYQFPQYCGAHVFSLISNKQTRLLMYHDAKYQRNIIDTLSGHIESKPGLWDKDDHVSSELLSVNQLINNKQKDTSDLGWIMKVNDNEKSRLGRSYSSAVKETSKCF